MNIRQLIERILGSGIMTDRTELRSFTGRMAWVANLCPQVSTFTQMLWAAVSARADHKLVYLKQVIMPLEWILAFTKVFDGPLVRFSGRGPRWSTL